MPYLYEAINIDDPKRGTALDRDIPEVFDRWLPEASAQVKAQTTRIEVWVSSFSDPGDDWNEWRCFNAQGQRIYTHRAAGY